MAPTEPTSIIRNQFISMNSDKRPAVIDHEKGNGNKAGTSRNGFSSSNKSVNKVNKHLKKKKPVKLDYDEWAENEDEDWRTVDDEEDDERSTTRKPPSSKIKYSNDAYAYNKQVEESLDEDTLDEMPNISFKQYTNYHPVYSTFGSTNSKNGYASSQYSTTVSESPYRSASSIIYQTTRTPYQTTSTEILFPTTMRNRKHYMLLTGK